MTYIGYDQGNTQIFYGLTQLQETFYARKLNKVIALAPCVFYNTALMGTPYAESTGWYRDQSIYGINSEQWPDYKDLTCAAHPGTLQCTQAAEWARNGETDSVKSMEWTYQIAESNAYQNYMPSYPAEADAITPGLASIEVPIWWFIAEEDETCTPA